MAVLPITQLETLHALLHRHSCRRRPLRHGLLGWFRSRLSGAKPCVPPFLQLRGDDRFAMVSWRRMFQLLVTVVRQYMPGAWFVSRGVELGIWCGAVHACW